MNLNLNINCKFEVNVSGLLSKNSTFFLFVVACYENRPDSCQF